MSVLCSFPEKQQYADLAHPVERDLPKVEVAGSSPVIRSKIPIASVIGIFTFPVTQTILMTDGKSETWGCSMDKR